MSSPYSVLLFVAASNGPLRYSLTARSDDGAKKQARKFCMDECLGDGLVVVERHGIRLGAWFNNHKQPLWVL